MTKPSEQGSVQCSSSQSNQGKGYGQEVIILIEDVVDAEYWELKTILQEERNCHFYEKMGYRKTGLTQEVDDRMTIVSYEKRKNRGAPCQLRQL